VKVVVVTTSYPRDERDVAGVFLRDGVDALRAEGVEVDVVSPATVPHFGLAYGAGIPENIRRAPWKALLVPAFLASLARATRRAARDADLVHAHWLPSGLAACAAARPYVVQLHGTDAELARHLPWAFRPVVRGARLALCPSPSLADAARALGAREVVVVPEGVAIPSEVGLPDEPPHVLYVGRLSKEKGVLELAQAAQELPLVVVGDGPLRARLPASATAVGFVPPAEVGSYLERAAVVVCPSRREGYGIVARQALAHGRPVVASRVGGLPEVVLDGETGLLVPPRDPAALRAALERLLGDEGLRARLGTAGRALAVERLGLQAAARATIAAYERALGR
jgi:glycosyltransferase involved in cell wall biosynthesis